MANRINIIVEKTIDDIEEEIILRYEEVAKDSVSWHGVEFYYDTNPEAIFDGVAEDLITTLYARLKNRNFFRDFHDL